MTIKQEQVATTPHLAMALVLPCNTAASSERQQLRDWEENVTHQTSVITQPVLMTAPLS
jgi:hypothetical protein